MRIDTTGKPMMGDADIKAIIKLISQRSPATVLEWGSGNSTIFFSQDLLIKRWVSVEHNGNYVKHLAPLVNREKVTLI